ncbi:MAG: hypothetical protein KJ574_02855 [Nanoarchaeota archaeon]|nr:hypothetical protein [Nanoarchaeota archaeon]
MKDQLYIRRENEADEIYRNLTRDISAVAIRINKGVYIFPFLSDMQAIVQIFRVREPAEGISLMLMPAIDDESYLRPLTDIIAKYSFELVSEEEAKEMMMLVPTGR